MHTFVYKNNKTGQKIYSDKKLDLKKLKGFELVMEAKNTQMKTSKTYKKKYKK